MLKTFPNIADQLEFVWQGDVGTGIGKVLRRSRTGPVARTSPAASTATRCRPGTATLTQAQLLDVVRHERETISGQVVPAKQIAADGTLLWPNGTPVLDPTTGLLSNPDGTPMLDPTTGKLTNPALVDSAKGSA